MKPNGVVLLASFDVQKNKKKNFRIITPLRTYEFKTETEEDRNSWIATLEVLLNHQLKLPTPDDARESVIFLENAEAGVRALSWNVMA